MQNSVPIVSVITVVYNGLDEFKVTLASVKGQTYKAIEFVVIDGGSKDGTAEFIKENASAFHYWKSEKDRGIYDAMNKGIQAATGDYLLFLNAGDTFYNNLVIEQIFQGLVDTPDIIYSDTLLVDEGYKEIGLRSEETTRRLPKVLNLKALKRGMVVCHQSILSKREITPRYSLDYPLAGDYEWLLRLVKASKTIQLVPTIIARYKVGGVSKKREKQSLKERWIIMQRFYGFIPTLIIHIGIAFQVIPFLFKKRQA